MSLLGGLFLGHTPTHNIFVTFILQTTRWQIYSPIDAIDISLREYIWTIQRFSGLLYEDNSTYYSYICVIQRTEKNHTCQSYLRTTRHMNVSSKWMYFYILHVCCFSCFVFTCLYLFCNKEQVYTIVCTEDHSAPW